MSNTERMKRLARAIQIVERESKAAFSRGDRKTGMRLRRASLELVRQFYGAPPTVPKPKGKSPRN